MNDRLKKPQSATKGARTLTETVKELQEEGQESVRRQWGMSDEDIAKAIQRHQQSEKMGGSDSPTTPGKQD